MGWPPDRRRRIALAAILLFCVVSRGGYVLYLARVDPDVAYERDSVSYIRPAQALVDHRRFDQAATERTAEFLRTPGYPVFIAVVRDVAGSGNTRLLLAQAGLSTLTVFLAYVLATRLWSVTTGLVAGALVALEPLQFYTAGTLIAEGLSALALMTVVLVGFIVLTRDEDSLRWSAGLGLALALATMVRPVSYYLPLLAAALLGARLLARRVPGRRTMAVLAAFAVPLVVILGGWQLRNHLRVDSWRISGIEGKNLYQWRAAGVLAERDGVALDVVQRRFRAELGPIGDRTQGSFYEWQYRQGLAILRAQPYETIQVTARGLWSELFGVQTKVARYLRIQPLSGVAVAIATAVLLAFYLGAAYGLALVIKARRFLVGHAFVVGTALYVLVVSAGPESLGARGERLRAPVMAIVALYTAHGALAIWNRRRRADPGARSQNPGSAKGSGAASAASRPIDSTPSSAARPS